MDVVYNSCGAFMWIDERKSTTSKTTPKFQSCCEDGKVILRPSKPNPDVIAKFLRNNAGDSKEFKQNIRSYNSALSFTLMNADLDRNYVNSRHGAYAFRIRGPSTNDPRYKSFCYLFKSMEELSRMIFRG